MARTAPWLGIGTEGEWLSPFEALSESDLLYNVEQTDAYDDMGQKIPGIIVNRREDNGRILGHVTDRYGVIQNIDAFSLLDPFSEAGGIIEHAGMDSAGMVFMVMRMPSQAFGFGGDDFDLYVCAMNSFNGNFPLAVFVTPLRVYCQNMFRKMINGNDNILRIKHGTFANDRIESAKDATKLLLGYEVDFVNQLDEMATLGRSPHEVEEWIAKLFPKVPVDDAHPRAVSSNAKVDQMREIFLNNFYYAEDNLNYTGTKLGLVNAYYDWLSHGLPSRQRTGYEERRFDNLMLGRAVDTKLIAQA